jgi:hypothetical protein
LSQDSVEKAFASKSSLEDTVLSKQKKLLIISATKIEIFREEGLKGDGKLKDKLSDYFDLALDTHSVYFHALVAFIGGIAS